MSVLKLSDVSACRTGTYTKPNQRSYTSPNTSKLRDMHYIFFFITIKHQHAYM